MAYMNQERKAILAANLKKVIPADWKYRLSVQNHSTIVLTISQAPVDLIGEAVRASNKYRDRIGVQRLSDIIGTRPTHLNVNDCRIEEAFETSRDTMVAIAGALNDGNHNRSDLQSDYHDVGWYVSIRFGRWNKPFVCTAAAVAA